jgi:hypothetical protein
MGGVVRNTASICNPSKYDDRLVGGYPCEAAALNVSISLSFQYSSGVLPDVILKDDKQEREHDLD